MTAAHPDTFAGQVVNKYARAAGICYLIIIASGLLSELFIKSGLIVSGNATATAASIIHSNSRWRLAVGLDLLMHVCDIPVLVILYYILKPVNRFLALMVLLFEAVQSAVLIAVKLNLITALLYQDNTTYLHAFSTQQLSALSMIATRSDAYGFGIGLIFFGCGSLVLGYLVMRSTYLPGVIGILMMIAGLCYLINSIALIIYPPLASKLFPAILLPAFVAEVSFALRLVMKGVNVDRWNIKIRFG